MNILLALLALLVAVTCFAYYREKKELNMANETAILTGECPICGSRLEKFYHDFRDTIYVCTHCNFAAHRKQKD